MRKTGLAGGLLLALALGSVGGAEAEEYAAPVLQATRPNYKPLRFDEDWRGLGSGALARSDFFDPAKHVALGPDGDVSLSLGGQLRARFESWDDYDFFDQDSNHTLTRLRAHADLRVGESVRAFVELKSAQSTHNFLDRMVTDVDAFDVQNAFVELALPKREDFALSVRGGRQELLLGRERLIGPSDWLNVRRTFDGVTVRAGVGGAQLTALWLQSVVVREYRWNSSISDPSRDLWGLWLNTPIGGPALKADAYWLRANSEVVQDRDTAGARLSGAIPDSPFDFDLEYARQWGHDRGSEVRAQMASAELGLWFAQRRCSPRFFVGYELGSGDGDPFDDLSENFDDLFPSGHRQYGIMDLTGRANTHDLYAGVSFRPAESLSANLSVHRFRLDREGPYIRPGEGEFDFSDYQSLGTEIDAGLRWQYDVHLAIDVGYGHFFPGKVVRASFRNEDADFAYAEIAYTF